MFENYELTFKLFKIFLEDETEHANISAINAITHTFDADAGAIFYKNSLHKYIFSLSGSVFPIELSKERWQQAIKNHVELGGVQSFTGWTPPGFDLPVQNWLSVPLLTSGTENGYVFLGKNGFAWSEEETNALLAITEVISEIVSIRVQKQMESLSRLVAEKELAQTQRRMTQFFESFHDTIYTLSPDSVFTSINNAGLKLFGLESDKEIIGKPFPDFAVNEDVHDFFLKKIKKEGYIDDLEILLKNKDGTQIYCLETSYAVADADGKIVEIQGMIKDITDRIKNERELWKMNLELAEVNVKLQQANDFIIQQEKLASIGQLAAGIAHEINNPLGFLISNQKTLISYFDTIRKVFEEFPKLDKAADLSALLESTEIEYVLSEATQIFKESDDGFGRIMRIIQNLKTFARMDQNIKYELFDVNAGIESTLVVAWNEIKFTAEIVKKFGDIPKIYAKAGEINQVILNILVNAAQAIGGQKRPEKGTIRISTSVENSFVAIVISDDGPGIPASIVSRIFDPFFTTKEPGKGTGLGLSISYDIVVTKHKGKLSVTSQPGEGSSFRIELPLNPGEIPVQE